MDAEVGLRPGLGGSGEFSTGLATLVVVCEGVAYRTRHPVEIGDYENPSHDCMLDGQTTGAN
jgi:hypothetical protein